MDSLEVWAPGVGGGPQIELPGGLMPVDVTVSIRPGALPKTAARTQTASSYELAFFILFFISSSIYSNDGSISSALKLIELFSS